MLRKGLGVLLTAGVLCATGIASGTPCCTLLTLDSGHGAGAPAVDCCESTNCCSIEKQGPAQAELLATLPGTAGSEASFVSHPLFIANAEALLPATPALKRFTRTDHSPPPGGRDTYLRVSLLRI
jgi:hypothetical protein